MTIFKSIKSKDIDEFAEWLDKYGKFDNSPWIEWFDKKYCKKCMSEYVYSKRFEKEIECAWCEIYKKCKHFPDLDWSPDNEDIIKLWLESEIEDKEKPTLYDSIFTNGLFGGFGGI